MRGIVSILFLLLVGWMIGCTYCYVCHIKDLCYGEQTVATSTASFPAFLARDGNFSASSSKSAIFDRSGAAPEISSNLQNAYKNVANYLKENGNRNLKITGQYNSAETNPGKFKNLGISRAEAIKQAILSYGSGLNASRILTAGSKNEGLKFINEKTAGGLAYQFMAAAAPAPKAAPINATSFGVSDGSFSASGPFAMFAKSGSDAEMNPGLNTALGQIAGYLKSNPGKSLKITGEYTNQEKNYSWFDNLGIARAEDIKKAILANDGSVESARIETAGRLNNQLKFAGDKTNGNLSAVFMAYNAANAANMDGTMQALGKTLKAAPRNFYFDPGSSIIDLDAEMRVYFRDLKKYLNYYPKETINLTGHTDADGDAGANKRLGMSRAKLIQDYMSRNGIKAAQVKTNSKGEESPIASNDTPEGKAKNRRVEISF